MPLVSIVMPVFNGEKWLAEAIESILAQTFTDFELIIVDDGSRDRSAEIIRAYEKRDGRIRFFQLECNSGTAVARNHAVAVSIGTYITFLDCDDVCLPERLQKQVDVLQSKPEIGGVGTHAKVVDADLQKYYDLTPPMHHALILLSQFIEGKPFVHASLMLRRDLILDVGGFDQRMGYAADSDMVIRLMGRTRFTNITERLYIYRRHEDSLSSQRNAKRDHDVLLMRTRRFERLWGEAPPETLNRFAKLRPFSKLSWRERRAAKRDITRLIESMIVHGWIGQDDRPLLIAEMNSRLEQACPRIWQMFCHWRRHHFQR